MHSPPLSVQRPRKRRAINACVACRRSKVRCDGQRPCTRCARNDTECDYAELVVDGNVLRIERLEAEVEGLKAALDLRVMREMSGASPVLAQVSPETVFRVESEIVLERPLVVHSETPRPWRQPAGKSSAVDAGLINWTQATFWFQSFFSGSHYLIPVFCPKTDTLESIASRSPFLFDSIVTVGCRAEEGCNSQTYHRLQSRLREHLADVLVTTETPSLETVQAIAVMAGYSENGMLLVALALRFATQLHLQDAVDRVIERVSADTPQLSDEDHQLYRLARVWHGVCNLNLFFSLDGGKLPGITLQTSPRRIRALVNHPSRTATDIRLLSQIELNTLRSTAYTQIARHSRDQDEASMRTLVRETAIELSLWSREWTALICDSGTTATQDTPQALTNLHIQHDWALITLYLKAASAFGDLLMTDFQRDMVRAAKDAAVRHLHHLLDTPSSPAGSPTNGLQNLPPTYLQTFKYTIDFVWAKCAFSVLLVLKLALLLRDPLPAVIQLLRDARQVLGALHKLSVGHIAYFQILQTSVEKCEGALREHMARVQQGVSGNGDREEGPGEGINAGRGDAEDEFQEYAPSAFCFEWDFPGLNLRNVPVGWQDLFVDLDLGLPG